MDGVGDNGDKFPSNDAASIDIDNDGFPNEWNITCDLTCQQNSGLVLDNCPLNANPSQLDTDIDGLGDTCDSDDDNDGVDDWFDRFPLDVSVSVDNDWDGSPDNWNAACDATCQLNSGLALDNCIGLANFDQLNTDGDAFGDVCDWDDDNDGVLDTIDAAPLDAGNTNEIILLLDGIYKGGALKQNGATQ